MIAVGARRWLEVIGWRAESTNPRPGREIFVPDRPGRLFSFLACPARVAGNIEGGGVGFQVDDNVLDTGNF